nr:MAG TPA: hypothetical protein [Bacteriophage sp.]
MHARSTSVYIVARLLSQLSLVCSFQMFLTSCHCKGNKNFQTTKTSEKFFLR